MFIKSQKFPAGTLLWGIGKMPLFCFFLYSGEIEFTTPPAYAAKRRTKIHPGTIVGDFPALAGETECLTEMKAVTDIEVLVIKKEDWLLFLGKNPGIMLIFKDEYIVQ